jgi:hypothetical protein
MSATYTPAPYSAGGLLLLLIAVTMTTVQIMTGHLANKGPKPPLPQETWVAALNPAGIKNKPFKRSQLRWLTDDFDKARGLKECGVLGLSETATKGNELTEEERQKFTDEIAPTGRAAWTQHCGLICTDLLDGYAHMEAYTIDSERAILAMLGRTAKIEVAFCVVYPHGSNAAVRKHNLNEISTLLQRVPDGVPLTAFGDWNLVQNPAIDTVHCSSNNEGLKQWQRLAADNELVELLDAYGGDMRTRTELTFSPFGARARKIKPAAKMDDEEVTTENMEDYPYDDPRVQALLYRGRGRGRGRGRRSQRGGRYRNRLMPALPVPDVGAAGGAPPAPDIGIPDLVIGGGDPIAAGHYQILGGLPDHMALAATAGPQPAAVQDLGAYQGDAILVGALADNADLQMINDLTDQADPDDAPAVDGNTVLMWPNDDDEAEITAANLAECSYRDPRVREFLRVTGLDEITITEANVDILPRDDPRAIAFHAQNGGSCILHLQRARGVCTCQRCLQTADSTAQAGDAHGGGGNAVDGDTVLERGSRQAKRCGTPPDPRPAKKTEENRLTNWTAN